MNDQSIDKLWRSLISDGLVGIFDRTFDSARFAGMIAEMQRAGGSSTGEAGIGAIAAALPMAGLAGQGGISNVLQGIPLAGGLLRHFLKEESVEKTPEAVRYTSPAAIRLNAGLPSSTSEGVEGGAQGWVSQGGERTSPTVVINVNAMDSMSILDRSDDIANAVRQAMLTYQPFDDIWR